MMNTVDKIKQFVKEQKGRIILYQDFEGYVEDLEEKLQQAKNTLDGADGEPPEVIVKIVTHDGCEIELMGKEEKLKELENFRD